MIDVSVAYRDRAVLVTGGLGFIGVNLVQALAGAGARVTVLARRPGAVPPGVRLVVGDVRDAAVVDAAVGAQDVVFHLAGQSGAVRSMDDPWTDLDINCRGSLVLLEVVRRRRPEARVVYPGSRLELGRPVTCPVDETHPLDPLCAHGVHKLAVEKYFGVYAAVYGLRTVVLRVPNPYGPGQPSERAAYGIVNRFVHLAVANAALPIYGDGSQVRDYIFIDDLVDAFLQVGASPIADGKVYNVGSGKGLRLIDMACAIIEAAGGGRVEYVDWDPVAARIETGDFVADISKITAELGWRPGTPLEDGVARTVAACRAGARASEPR